MLKNILPDLFLIAGATGLSYGSWLAWPPAGFLVGGILLLVTGIHMARAG